MDATGRTRIFLLILLTIKGCACAGNDDEKALVRHLLQDYDTNVRPVETPSDKVVVVLDLVLNQILDLDERNQVLTANYWSRLSWTDSSMKWDPKDHGGLTRFNVNVQQVWRPDITLYNDVSEQRRNLELLYPATVMSDGTVSWNTPAIYRSSCPLDVSYFPWDEQGCELEFGSWTYDGNSLDIHNKSERGVMDYFTPDGEWEFIDFPVYRKVDFYPAPFPSIIYTVMLKRKPLYYLFNIALPCVFITFCGMLVFLLPPDSGEKVSMSVTLLLASTVFLLLVSEIMPPQSDVVPLMGKYFLAAILLLVLSTVMTVLVLNAHHRARLAIRVPRLIRVAVLKGLASVVCMRGTVRAVLKELEVNGVTKVKPFHPDTNTGKENLPRQDDAADDHPERCEKEWMLVAMVMDRAFLIAFLIVTLVVTCVILLDHP